MPRAQKIFQALRRALKRIWGPRVVITYTPKPKIIDQYTTHAYLRDDGYVSAFWFNGQQLILNSDHSVTGLPGVWSAKWRILDGPKGEA